MIMGRSLNRLRNANYEIMLGSIMFHVRRRPADCQPRRRKKKSGSLRASGAGGAGGVLIETHSDGSPLDNGRNVRIGSEIVEVGSANGVALQLYGPSIQPRHCVLACNDGVVTLTPVHADAQTYVNGQRIYHTTILQHGCIVKFDRISTFRFVDPSQENKLNRQTSQSQNFDSGSVYDRSPTSPMLDSSSGTMNQTGGQAQMDNFMESPGEGGFPRAMSPMMNSNIMGSQDNFGMAYNMNNNKNHMDGYQISGYSNNNNNNNIKGDCDTLPQQFSSSSKSDVRENHFASPYNAQPTSPIAKEHNSNSSGKAASGQYKDNYETTFDLDGNVETKSICSAKSGGSGHENRMPRGQEAILPAVLEFPESTQYQFLQNVVTKLDVNAPAFKLAPVYTLYLCARYRASTHYRPELTPTERAHKLTTLLHHIATLIQTTVQEKYSDATVQAFWMANSSELLHFLKCDRHISAFTVQAQDILSNSVQTAFSNLVGCFHTELSQVLVSFLEETSNENDAVGAVIGVLISAMNLLRRCRVNAALTIQLFSQLFYYINVWCFNKVVNSPYMMCSAWGGLIASRLAPISAWAERQGLELAADYNFALINQCAHLLQAPKSTPENIATLTSACSKLNSVQLRCLLGGYFEDSNGTMERLPSDLVEVAVKHAQGVADELHRADGREIALEENSSLPLSLLIPEDGFSADVVRGIPSGLAEFLSPLQRAGLCRLAPQPHSQGHWTVYMTGFNGSGATKTAQQPVVEVIQLQKNSNGIGLSIVAAKGAGQSKLGIYIKSVVPGGAAAIDQRLQAGDQLLAVDGYSLVGITQERAAEHLVRTGPVVTLHVAKQGAVLHGLATLLRQPSPQTSRGGYYTDYHDNSQLSNKGRGQHTSSNDSLNSFPVPIPRVKIQHCDDDDEDEDDFHPDDYHSQEFYDRLRCLDPTFYQDYSLRTYLFGGDNSHSNNAYSYSKKPSYSREQSVDSNTQSCDSSECSLACSMENLERTKPVQNSSNLAQSSSINYDEIPYIDDDGDVMLTRQYMMPNHSKNDEAKKISSIPARKSFEISTYCNKAVDYKDTTRNVSKPLNINKKDRKDEKHEHNFLEIDCEESELRSKNSSKPTLVSKKDDSSTNLKSKIDNVEFGYGKVKAIANHFNSINVAYQTKIPNKRFPSDSDLSRSPIRSSTTKSNSMVNMSLSEKSPSKTELTDEEKKMILLQLDDWSKNGTRGTIDVISPNLLRKDTKHTSVNHLNDEFHSTNPRLSNLDRKFGSLERLTNSNKSKKIEFVLYKTKSTPAMEEKRHQPAIPKTKLVMPRKKFPHAYIVRRKTDKVNETAKSLKKSSVGQSCPNFSEDVNFKDRKKRSHGYDKLSKSVSEHNIDRRSHSKCGKMENRHSANETKSSYIRNPSKSNSSGAPKRKSWKSFEEFSPRRMSERDLPSKVEMEQNPPGHMPATVKSSKSVPALHEHMKQQEVFNPGYSRASSNNSIPAMVGLKNKTPPTSQTDQNSFYQNLSVYRTSALGDRSSTLRNSQNNLPAHIMQGQQHQPKNIPMENQNVNDRLPGAQQRPQSAYFGNQNIQNNVMNSNNNSLRTAQSSKDLAYGAENVANQVKTGYPSMPNVNQAYPANPSVNGSQSYNQIPGANPANYNYNNNNGNIQSRGPMSPPANMYNSASPGGQYPNQIPYGQQQNQMQYNQFNHLMNYNNNPAHGSNPNLRGQAKLMEMSEEVTRRQQRASVNSYVDHPIKSPLQPKRPQYNQDGSPAMGNMNIPMSPTKQQPPVAPKPQNLKRDSALEGGHDVPEGPPLPPTSTHPLYSHQPIDEDGSYLASTADPPAVSYYPTHRPSNQNNQSHLPPNPWEREEREREMEARRNAARGWRDQQIASLQSLTERTPQQEQQLRALTLERDFERRAQEAQVDEDDKDAENRYPKNTQSGLLRLANNNNSPQDINLVPVASNIVSSKLPVSVAMSNANGGDMLADNTPTQQDINRMSNAPPPVPPPIQPKSILKSNLRLDNIGTSSPQSPSKSQKNASFSANLTPQSSKFDYSMNQSSHSANLSKYGEQQQQLNAYGGSAHKYDVSNANVMSPNQLSQAMGELYVNSPSGYNRMDNSAARFDMQQQQSQENIAPPPPPPERGSSFAVMSQQQALRSNLSTTVPMTAAPMGNYNQNNNLPVNNTLIMKDKRVSFHDKDAHAMNESRDDDVEMIREDPDRFIMEAENMLQSPSTPTGSNVTHTPGVIGAQEVYRDPRQKRLAEQQKAQQAESTPIPEKLSFKEKMKMFALESGESNTPKDKVKISRAQRDIDAVH